MFDVGFSELVIIALVALVVIGPERLPKVARTVGVLLGRLQRYVSDVKSDINREIQLDELKKMQEQLEGQAREMQDSLSTQMRTVEESLNHSIAPPESPAVVNVTAQPAGLAEFPPLTDPVAHAPEQQLELGLDSTSGKAAG